MLLAATDVGDELVEVHVVGGLEEVRTAGQLALHIVEAIVVAEKSAVYQTAAAYHNRLVVRTVAGNSAHWAVNNTDAGTLGALAVKLEQ